MDSQPSPIISSFVIRFVVDPESNTYRGEIRHIQSGQETAFTHWEDAQDFIRNIVPIGWKLENDKQ